MLTCWLGVSSQHQRTTETSWLYICLSCTYRSDLIWCRQEPLRDSIFIFSLISFNPTGFRVTHKYLIHQVDGNIWLSDDCFYKDAFTCLQILVHEFESVDSRHHTRETRAREQRDASICQGELLEKIWVFVLQAGWSLLGIICTLTADM